MFTTNLYSQRLPLTRDETKGQSSRRVKHSCHIKDTVMASPLCSILQDSCLLVPSSSLQRRHLSLPHLFVSDYSDYYDSSDSDDDDVEEEEEISLDSATGTQYTPADSSSSTNGHGEDMIDGDDDQDKSTSPYFNNIRGQMSSQRFFNQSATHKSDGTRTATVLTTSRTTEITIEQQLVSPLATDAVKSTEKIVKVCTAA